MTKEERQRYLLAVQDTSRVLRGLQCSVGIPEQYLDDEDAAPGMVIVRTRNETQPIYRLSQHPLYHQFTDDECRFIHVPTQYEVGVKVD